MAADAVGGASSAEGGGGAAPAEPAAPARRGQMYIDGVTDADIAAARHVPLADRLKAMVYWSIFVILALDEELVVALGGTVWLYKTAQRAARSVLTVSPVSVLCGAAAAVCASSTVSLFSGAAAQRLAARAATLPLPLLSRPLWVGRPGAAAAREALAWWPAAGVASQHAQAAQQSWVLRGGAATVLASGAHRFSPALWGVRLGVHLAVMARFMRHQRPREELPLRLRLSLACAAAAWSEWWARVLCAPAARIAHEASANPGLGPWGAARRVWACGGLQALWRGAPPLRVELPHMALQLGGFTALRDAAIYRLGLEWDPEAPWWRRVAPRLPVDAACGAASAAAAHAATHRWRAAVELSRREAIDVIHLGGEALVLPRPGAFLPLAAVLAVRVPHAAVLFACYGALHGALRPEVREAGFSGWGDTQPTLSRYGEVVGGNDSMANDFWSLFGVMLPQARDWSPRPRRPSADSA
eukprot:TRINITY_DN28498_c0_g1_i2.p2 TRINITY_DN28498_c0_g1~~TRINITY_DN28498_c0_g1_i2.p2  ORF type:complete len:491 (+),score=153.60 TRINITY_DN28498_c0_g1_i2:59-1474(+)